MNPITEEKQVSRQQAHEAGSNHSFRGAGMGVAQVLRRQREVRVVNGGGRSSRRIFSTRTDPAKAKKPGSLVHKEPGISVHVDTEALLESVKFNKGSIEELIAKGLEGKMKKAESNLVAIELGKLINCSTYYYGMTVDKHAASREVGLRLARLFIRTYFDAPEDAKACIERIKVFIERNEMLEKGYYFWEGHAYESYKPIPISIVYLLGGVRWSRETVAAFKDNENRVAEIIETTRANVSDSIVAKKLDQIFEKISLIGDAMAGA